MRRDATDLIWQRLHWRRPITANAVTELLRLWAADPRAPRLVLEVRSGPSGVRYLLGVPELSATYLSAQLRHVLPGAFLSLAKASDRPQVSAAGSIRISRNQRALRTTDPESVVRASLAALTTTTTSEHLVLQLVIGPRVGSQFVAATPATIASELPLVLTLPTPKDSEARAALRTKRAEPAFRVQLRIGSQAASRSRRRSLMLGLLNGLRVAESPGVRIRLVPDSSLRLDRAANPWWWHLTLNVDELTGLLVWPIGDSDLPGVLNLHPVLLPPAESVTQPDRAFGTATAPGHTEPIGLTTAASMRHTWVLGPTGSGKSTLLQHLITQDIDAGRGVLVIEPKGDLVDAILERIPEHRRADVVVLDPTDDAPVGCNPLTAPGSAEVRADALLSVMRELYADAWGPRTQDIVHAGLLTLTRHGRDTSLLMLPLLLTNQGFRRSITKDIAAHDPVALGPFWSWFESLSEGARAEAIAPVMNKLRAFLLDKRMRAVLGQTEPRFDIAQVLSEGKILLVPLRRGSLGQGSAQLLGSLILATFWQASLTRTNVPATRRKPVMVYLDEVQDYLHLPTDLADALATARGLHVGFTMAHQYLGQLPRDLRAGLLGNVGSRVCFQLDHDDATVMAKGHPELSAADFSALPAFHAYASLTAGGRRAPYVSLRTAPPEPVTSDRWAMRRASMLTYGVPANETEQRIHVLAAASNLDAPSSGRRRRATP
jgi:hypothetical protein